MATLWLVNLTANMKRIDMKKFKHKVAAGLVLCTLTAGMPGGAIAGADVVKLCKNISKMDDPDIFVDEFGSLGQCTSFFRTYPADACQMLEEEGRLLELGWTTQGDCVSDLVKKNK